MMVNLDIFNINVYTKLYQILSILKILSGNEILTSIKGCNTFTNLRKIIVYNPNLDCVNINVCTKFGQILSICSQHIEQK